MILDPGRPIHGLADSKALSPRRRERLEERIQAEALAWGLGRAEAEEIDQLNILQASLLAMRRAVEALEIVPARILVDGNRCPEIPGDCRAIVGGDASVPVISAASILAKQSRDREMVELDAVYPSYGFARHKGYPTREHLEALRQLGVTPVHRLSFAPVRRLVAVTGDGPE